MRRLPRKNIAELAEEYNISRRRNINEGYEKSANRLERELVEQAQLAKRKTEVQPHGFGKDAGWLTTALSFSTILSTLSNSLSSSTILIRSIMYLPLYILKLLYTQEQHYKQLQVQQKLLIFHYY